MEGDQGTEMDVGDNTLSVSEPPSPSSRDSAASQFAFKNYRPHQRKRPEYTNYETFVLGYQTLGIVYGDIGTSPLYVISSIQLDKPSDNDILGILSLIFWILTLIPLIKYVFIVLRADDNGEGGTFALYTFLCRHLNLKTNLTIHNTKLDNDSSMHFYTQHSPSAVMSKTKEFIERNTWFQSWLTFIVMLGTCMVIGDGALTPATSVLSALSGIQSLSDRITQNYVIIMAVGLIFILFSFQRFGTNKVGSSFSPIMVAWFVLNVIVAIYNIATYRPGIFKALSPYYMFEFFYNNGYKGFTVLGAVFLCTTGGEAMFADLGHFNKRSIQIAFSTVVYPSLVITYAGQVAYLTKHPENMKTVFYSSIPDILYWPMFVVATLAAIVASQSMISASFSIVKQALALGCFPRVNMKHTSSKFEGQVYSPEINYILMFTCILLIVGFRDGVAIGNAYGVVVIWVMIITTFLVTLVMMVIWDTNIVLTMLFFVPFILIEGAFMVSLLNKIPQGGWAPFAIASFFLIITMSWTHGRSKKTAYDTDRKMNLHELESLLSTKGIYRPNGVCFFCTDLVNGIPPIIRHYIQTTNSAREIMIIVTIRTLPIKTVLPEERYDVGKLGGVDGVYRCLVQYGYRDEQSIDGEDFINSVVRKIQEVVDGPEEGKRLEIAIGKGFAFITGRTILRSSEKNGWLSHIAIDYMYRFLQKNSTSAVSGLKMPPGKTLQVGMLYEI